MSFVAVVRANKTFGLDFTCPTYEIEETIPVKAGDTFAFNTNDGPKYSKKMNCKVHYIMEASCQKMRLSCQRFQIVKGDYLIVQKGNAKSIK